MVYLSFFKAKNTYTIQEIEWWLDENWDKYRDLKDVWECSKCPTNECLPCICAEPDEEWKFFKLYEALDLLLKLHKKEAYFKQEMLAHRVIQFSERDLKYWTAKNEGLGVNDYSDFEFNYLNYECRDDTVKHLRVADSELSLVLTNTLREKLGRQPLKTRPTFEVFVNRDDFKYTLEFLDTFRTLFWDKEVL